MKKLKPIKVIVNHLQGLNTYSEAMDYLQQFSIKQLKEIAVGLNLILVTNISKANLKHIIYINCLIILGSTYTDKGWKDLTNLSDQELVNYLYQFPDAFLNLLSEKMQLQLSDFSRESVITSIVSQYNLCTCGSRLTSCICK